MLVTRSVLMRFPYLFRQYIFLSFYLFLVINHMIMTSQTENGSDYFFSVNIMAPTSSPVRLNWVEVALTEFAKIGIGTELDLISWAALGPRATDQEVGDYKDGGYDLITFGMSMGNSLRHPGSSIQAVYSAEAIPPNGFNVMYWNDNPSKHYLTYRAQESDDLIQTILSNLNLTESKEQFVEWQKIWYDAMPNILVYNRYKVHAISSNLYGYDPVFYPLQSIDTMWGLDSVVLAASIFNTNLETSIYNQYYIKPTMVGLIRFTPSKDLVLPLNTSRETWMTTNFGTTEYLKLIPGIATTLGNFSSDGLQFNITIRDDVFFHDGYQLDGWDIAFSMQTQLIPSLNSNFHDTRFREWWDEWILPFGLDDKVNRHGNYSIIVEDKDNNGFSEHISFNFIKIFPSFLTDILGFDILPEHILGDPINHGFDNNGNFDPNLWIVPPSEWKSHSFNTGCPTDPGGLKGPIGAGPVIFKEYNTDSNEIILEKFDGIRWDNTTGAWIADPSLKFFEFAEGKWKSMPPSAKIIFTTLDPALTAMKTGKVTLMDPQFQVDNIYDELQTSSAITPILTTETGWIGLYLNPKFEEGGIFHLNKKGVRHAISHIIPREEIINKLMNGLAVPTYTPIPITSWAAISEADLVAYKKAILGSDGITKPEHNAITTYDEYSIEVALKWMESEGYETTSLTTLTSTTKPREISGFSLCMSLIIIIPLALYRESKLSSKRIKK